MERCYQSVAEETLRAQSQGQDTPSERREAPMRHLAVAPFGSRAPWQVRLSAGARSPFCAVAFCAVAFARSLTAPPPEAAGVNSLLAP